MDYDFQRVIKNMEQAASDKDGARQCRELAKVADLKRAHEMIQQFQNDLNMVGISTLSLALSYQVAQFNITAKRAGGDEMTAMTLMLVDGMIAAAEQNLLATGF